MNCKKCGEKVFSGEVCRCGEKAPKPYKGRVAINSVICGVLLFWSVVSLIVTISLRNIDNNDRLINSINDLDLCSVEISDGVGKKVPLDEYINSNFINDPRISVENVDNILKDDFIKEFIISKLDDIHEFCMNDGKAFSISSDEIVTLIDEKGELLYEEAGLNFLDGDKAALKESLAAVDTAGNIIETVCENWFTRKLIQTYFSSAFVMFLVILIPIIIIQWSVVNCCCSRRIGKVFRISGIITIIPSLLILISSVYLLFVRKTLIGMLLSDVKIPFMISSAVILAVGILFIVLSAMMSPSGDEITKNSVAEKQNTAVPEIQPELVSADNIVDETLETIDDNKAEIDVSETIEGLCPECGHHNKANSSFCGKCGTKLK